MIAATSHDLLAKQDYGHLSSLGIRTVREGLRWHLIEKVKGVYDFSSALSVLDAAEELGMEQVIDLLHFGWPDHVDIFAPDFADSFADFALQVAHLLRRRGLHTPYIAPINEISFLSWAGGEVEYLNPFKRGRGSELKRQLVRAGLLAAKVFMTELPGTSLLWPEPAIHICGATQASGDETEAEAHRLSMYEVWDMLTGRLQPELGGSPDVVRLIGVNFYGRNQWVHQGEVLDRFDRRYKPFHVLLQEIWERYRVPIIIAETGTEDAERAEWFAYISAEVRRAIKLGVCIEGVCLYPIVNHPGWDDDRHCHNGLLDYPDGEGRRNRYEPLAAEIALQQKCNAASL